MTSTLTQAFARNHPAEMASFLAADRGETLVSTILDLPEDAAAAVVSHLPHGAARIVLGQVSDQQATRWISEATLGQALNLVLRLDPARRTGILQHLPDRAQRLRLERLVVYPRRTLGALVDAAAIRLNADTPLHEAVLILRSQDDFGQGPIWVVDDAGRFLGQLDLARVVLISKDDAQVRDCLDPMAPLLAESSLLAAHDDPNWLQHLSLPVVDFDNHLLGSVTREQLLTALAEESPNANSMGDAVASLATQYVRFLSVCLAELLQDRNSR